MKILLLGPNGQLGWELQRSLAPLGQVLALGRSSDPCADLAQPERLAHTVRTLRPQVIVNAAAYTAVDQAETEPQQAMLVNALAPQALAHAACDIRALLVHYSSDYVLGGSGADAAAHSETTPPSPLSAYGRSKLAGEQYIQASGCQHLILRTSWVYAARGHNFVRTMLRLAQERETLRVVNDQWGAPTSAELIADASAHAIARICARSANHTLCGLYHLSASGCTTWHGLADYAITHARQIAPQRNWQVRSIQAVPTRDYPSAARRPANSRLNTTRLQQTFDIHLPDWQSGVQRVLREML